MLHGRVETNLYFGINEFVPNALQEISVSSGDHAIDIRAMETFKERCICAPKGQNRVCQKTQPQSLSQTRLDSEDLKAHAGRSS